MLPTTEPFALASSHRKSHWIVVGCGKGIYVEANTFLGNISYQKYLKKSDVCKTRLGLGRTRAFGVRVGEDESIWG